jgi:fluoride exporter
MTLPTLIGVAALGGVGAVARFGLDGRVGERFASAFPYGTLGVNILGSFIIGLLVGAGLRGSAELLLETGLIGAFTTFSTWMFESHRLAEDGQLRLGALNIVFSLALGILAAWTGRQLGAAL